VNQFNRSGLAAGAFAELADEVLAALAGEQAAASPGNGDELRTLALSIAGGESGLPARLAVASLAAPGPREVEPELEPDWAVEAAREHEPERGDEDRVLSLDEILEDEDDDGSRHRPSLDDYDGAGDEDYYH